MTTTSLKIIESVAAAEGVNPTDIEPVLAEVIDPQALDTLFDGREQTTGHVCFAFKGYEVLVRSNGTVDVYGSGMASAEESI